MQPMRTKLEGEGRIIPLRRDAVPVSEMPGERSETERLTAVPRDPVRHYLKFMLPAIPVVTFVMSLLYSYLLVGLNGDPVSPSDLSPLPLIGALLMALTTSMLCLAIYTGVLRASEHSEHSEH